LAFAFATSCSRNRGWIPAAKVLNRAAQGAQSHNSIRVRKQPVPSLCSLYLIGEVEESEDDPCRGKGV
jgi:hypothetical protein